jgi:hypothetical protein
MLFCLINVIASTCWSCQEGWYNFATDSGSYCLNLISFHSCFGVAFTGALVIKVNLLCVALQSACRKWCLEGRSYFVQEWSKWRLVKVCYCVASDFEMTDSFA